MFSKQIILYLFYNSIFLLLRTENERKGTNQNENFAPIPVKYFLNVKQFVRSVPYFSDSLRNPFVPERTGTNANPDNNIEKHNQYFLIEKICKTERSPG